MGNQQKNNIGEKFGKLKIIGYSGYYERPSGSKIKLYLCKCDCGNEVVIRSDRLKSGNTKSCGCYIIEKNKKRILPNNKSAINQIIKTYKRNADKRNIFWDLSFEQVEQIIKKPCYYCGQKSSNKYMDFEYNGIDRVNNNIGYKIENVVSCCKICNIAKHDMSKEDFIKWVRNVEKNTRNLSV